MSGLSYHPRAANAASAKFSCNSTVPPLLTAVTVTAAVPLIPSLVAVTVAEPGAPPVTSPVPLTVATPVLLLVHVTTRPNSTLPAASLRVAVSCCTFPTVTVAPAGDSVTDAIAAVDAPVVPVTGLDRLPKTAFRVSVPRYATSWNVYVVPAVRPSTVQVRFAPIVVPATGVAQVPRVTLGTDATPTLLLAHVTVRPLNAVPPASLGVAVSWTVWPACTLAAAGLTVTEATGTVVTDTVAVPLCPSLVAVMVAEPTVAAVTSPAPLTVATPVPLLAQVMARPASVLPFASLRVATSGTVPPTGTVTELGATLTDATGRGDGTATVMAAESCLPALAARITTVPDAMPRTTPAGLTVARPAFELFQLMAGGTLP